MKKIKNYRYCSRLSSEYNHTKRRIYIAEGFQLSKNSNHEELQRMSDNLDMFKIFEIGKYTYMGAISKSGLVLSVNILRIAKEFSREDVKGAQEV